METKADQVKADIETTAREIKKGMSKEEAFLDELKENGSTSVLVIQNDKGVQMYKTADLPNVLGLLKTAETMTTLDLQKSMMQPQGASHPRQPINS